MNECMETIIHEASKADGFYSASFDGAGNYSICTRKWQGHTLPPGRETTYWEEALEVLIERDFLKQHRTQKNMYQLTTNGWNLADEISNAGGPGGREAEVNRRLLDELNEQDQYIV